MRFERTTEPAGDLCNAQNSVYNNLGLNVYTEKGINLQWLTWLDKAISFESPAIR